MHGSYLHSDIAVNRMSKVVYQIIYWTGWMYVKSNFMLIILDFVYIQPVPHMIWTL